MNLAEFLDLATFEGDILVKAWDEESETELLVKFLDELTPKEVYLYSWPVRYVYPLTYYRKNNLVPCVVIEIHH